MRSEQLDSQTFELQTGLCPHAATQVQKAVDRGFAFRSLCRRGGDQTGIDGSGSGSDSGFA
jgi:hypothetical protein